MLGTKTCTPLHPTVNPVERRPCKGCLLLFVVCVALFLVLLYSFAGDAENSSCQSLAACIEAADEACQVSFSPDVHAMSGELDPSGDGCNATCTNGHLVSVVCVEP